MGQHNKPGWLLSLLTPDSSAAKRGCKCVAIKNVPQSSHSRSQKLSYHRVRRFPALVKPERPFAHILALGPSTPHAHSQCNVFKLCRHMFEQLAHVQLTAIIGHVRYSEHTVHVALERTIIVERIGVTESLDCLRAYTRLLQAQLAQRSQKGKSLWRRILPVPARRWPLGGDGATIRPIQALRH